MAPCVSWLPFDVWLAYSKNSHIPIIKKVSTFVLPHDIRFLYFPFGSWGFFFEWSLTGSSWHTSAKSCSTFFMLVDGSWTLKLLLCLLFLSVVCNERCKRIRKQEQGFVCMYVCQALYVCGCVLRLSLLCADGPLMSQQLAANSAALQPAACASLADLLRVI